MQKNSSHKYLLILFSFFLFTLVITTACSSRRATTKIVLSDGPTTPSVRLNINNANVSDLENLPRIGPVLAAKIVEHRDRYGPFRTPEQLLIVDGFSEKRFRELRPFIDTR